MGPVDAIEGRVGFGGLAGLAEFLPDVGGDAHDGDPVGSLAGFAFGVEGELATDGVFVGEIEFSERGVDDGLH